MAVSPPGSRVASMADSRSLVGGMPEAMIAAAWAGSSCQLLFVIVTNAPWPCSSSTGSASVLGTPNCASEGPMARRSRCFGPDPVMMNPPMPTFSPVCTSIRVERLGACAPGTGLGEGVGVGDGDGDGEGLGVGVGSGGVGVGVAVGVGDPKTSQGPTTVTVIGAPVLKNPIVALAACGAWSESNRKLYKVPQRMAFAFWFCPNVSELQVTAAADCAELQGALLNPAFPWVPSLGNPG